MKRLPLPNSSLDDKILASLQKLASDKKGAPIAEFSRMAESILSDVTHVMMLTNRVYDSVTGALPFGRIVEIYGTDASGKTALAKKAGMAAQLKNIYKRVITMGEDGIKRTTFEKLDPRKVVTHVLYIDNEQSFMDDNSGVIDGVQANFHMGRLDTVALLFKSMEDIVKIVEQGKKEEYAEYVELHKEWTAQQAQKKLKRARVSEVKDASPTTAESDLSGMGIVELPGPKAVAKKQKEEIKEEPFLAEHFIVVVVDTIASTSTDQELDQAWGTQDYSRHAKELRGAFRRVSREINKHNVCMICINQVSDSFAVKMKKNPNAMPDDSDYSTFGGRALKFYASQRILVQRVPKRYRLHPESKLEDGLLIEMKTVKNRLKKPLRKARLVLLFGDENSAGGGYSEAFSMLETFIMLGLASDDSGELTFRFKVNGLTPTTFGPLRGNPTIASRLEWPAFYAEHKVDFDELWTLAEKRIFSVENSIPDPLAGDMDDDDDVFTSKKKPGNDDLI